jgi:hypothetical protein
VLVAMSDWIENRVLTVNFGTDYGNMLFRYCYHVRPQMILDVQICMQVVLLAKAGTFEHKVRQYVSTKLKTNTFLINIRIGKIIIQFGYVNIHV